MKVIKNKIGPAFAEKVPTNITLLYSGIRNWIATIVDFIQIPIR